MFRDWKWQLGGCHNTRKYGGQAKYFYLLEATGADRAFTLLNALVAVLIVAIISCLAVPAFSIWLPNYRLRAAANDLYSSLQLAKMTAIEQGCDCSVCFNQAVGSEMYDYVVFIDKDGDLEMDPEDQIVVKRRWKKDNYEGISFDTSKGGGDGLTFANNDEGMPSIAFRPSGIPVSNTGGLGMGTAFLINVNNKLARIVVSSAGNIKIYN